MSRDFFRLISIFLFLLFSASLFAQENKRINHQYYYDFVNSIIHSDSLGRYGIVREPDFENIVGDTSLIFREVTLFTSEDVAFMRYQLASGQNFKWKQKWITDADVISDKRIKKYFGQDFALGWEQIKKRYPVGYIRFSVPLFTLDFNTCIIYIGKHCGSLCGSGGISVYKKNKGVWKYVTNIGSFWIS